MSQPWEQGSAAREHTQEPSSIFTRVDYEGRLKNAGRRAAGTQPQSFQPGQIYGYQPPVQSPPPQPAPIIEEPSYMAPPSAPYQLSPGAPYGMEAYQNGPTPFMPDAQEPEEAEAPLKDAFTPVKKPKPAQNSRVKPKKPPMRLWRVLSLLCAAVIVVICVRAVISLTQSERSLKQAREDYREENGVELHEGAVRLTLPPHGQTFAPTATPTPTVFVPTPAPTPRISVNEAAMAGAHGPQPEPEETEAPALRAKADEYEKNPLRNVMPSLVELRKQNEDVVGRLLIPGLLDEIVVSRNNTRYLTRDYLGQNSVAGSVFVDESCTLDSPPENLLLRGNVSVSGRTFAPLLQYVSGGQAFAASHAVCLLTTLYEEEQYVLFAVVCADTDPKSPGYFRYAGYPTFATDEAMMTYVSSVRSRSLYSFGVDVVPSDRLLTLATVGGSTNLVLVFRMARPGELI